MKRILFVTTRNPYSGRYSGDVIRSLKIINFLRKKFELDVVSLTDKHLKISDKRFIQFKYPNFFFRLLYCIASLFKFEPIQFGLFFSKEMKQHLENSSNEYDYLFFYHIRSSQYLPKNFYGKTVLEMGDLYSKNYIQTFNNLSFLNPLRYIYLIESLLIKKIESKIFLNFDRIILFSKSEVNSVSKEFSDKIFHISESVSYVKSSFSYSKKNSRILFIGNLNYLPNLLACRNFIIKVLPVLRRKIPEIKFCIIGSISKLNKILLPKNSNVEILGTQKNLIKYIKSSFCGLANLNIATGMQGKVLTYMSHGMPVICSEKVAENFEKNVLKYKKKTDLIEKIFILKRDKTQSKFFSKKSLKFSRNLIWKKISQKYLKLLNF